MIIKKTYLLALLVLSCLICFCDPNSISHEKRNPVSYEMIKGTWWLQSLTIRAVKNENTINIDSVYEYSSSTRLLNVFPDYLVYYVQIKSTDCDSIPTYRTVSIENYYTIEVDTIYLWTKNYEMRAKIELKGDTLIETIIVDKYNPYVIEYGVGTIENKYVKYNGVVLPPEWPSLCP